MLTDRCRYEVAYTLRLTIPVPADLEEASPDDEAPAPPCVTVDHETILGAALAEPDALETILASITSADVRLRHD